MFKACFALTLICALTVGITLGVGSIAFATPIDPGFDLFETQPGAFVPLPGIGNVALEGFPIGPGNTDTIVERLGEITPFAPPGGVDTIDIEMVALSLKSVNPIPDLGPLNPIFAGQPGDLFVTIDRGDMFPNLPQPDALPLSQGSMTIRHEGADGGTFDSDLFVIADLLFTVPGGDPNMPGDVLFSTPDPQGINLSSANSTWSHTAPPDDVHNAMFPAGDFYVGDIEHVGPHPIKPTPKSGPTLSEWGMIILTLLMLTFGTIGIRRHQPVIASVGVPFTSGTKTPLFVPDLFIKVLAATVALVLIGFALAIWQFGYTLTPADPGGGIISAIIFAYMVHLWILSGSNPQEAH